MDAKNFFTPTFLCAIQKKIKIQKTVFRNIIYCTTFTLD